MADEVEMTPVAGAEPPKANPLAKPAMTKVETIKLNPVARKPMPGAAPSPALKPGLKLPPKPGLGAGLKLPPKPGTATAALKPGLKLPTQNGFKPGLKLPTQTALKPGVKLPPKPVIRKPGATVAAAPLPKPLPKPVAPVAAAPKPEAPAVAKPAEVPVAAKPAAPEAVPVKPIAVDAQGVGKLPTVSATTIERGGGAPDVSNLPKPMEALKTVTQKLKGITQEIPQQAILHKTGIIAEGGASVAQKEAAKHKTARISLSDAMGVAPVKDEAAPMKTIRIKRPIDIPGATSSLTPPAVAPTVAPVAAAPVAKAPTAPAATPAAPATEKPAPAATVTQRKTLKIARPGGVAVRPGGKFGIKRPSQATTVAKSAPAAASAAAAPAGDAEVADIPDIPTNVPAIPAAAAPAEVEGPAWLWTMSAILQFAACVAIGALAWFLWENTQLPTYCGGLGWGQ